MHSLTPLVTSSSPSSNTSGHADDPVMSSPTSSLAASGAYHPPASHNDPSVTNLPTNQSGLSSAAAHYPAISPNYSLRELTTQTSLAQLIPNMEDIQRHFPAEGSMTPTSPSTPSPRNPFASSLNRDALLAYAYRLYDRPGGMQPGLTSVPLDLPLPMPSSSDDVYRSRLLPLLITLRSLHTRDLSVLLLMACTYHALGDLDASLRISEEILTIDPNFAEAMNNIGTTMQASNKNDQAYEWWWKAIHTRPTYWDAIDNMLGFLFACAQNAETRDRVALLYTRALDVCEFVQLRVLGNSHRPLVPVPPRELPRLQRLFLTSASIHLHSNSPDQAIRDYFTGIELMIQMPSPSTMVSTPLTMRDFILASFVAGYIVKSTSASPIPQEIADCLQAQGISLDFTSGQSGSNILRAVQSSGDHLLERLLHLGGNVLPFLLLLPEQISRLPSVLFSASSGVLPALCQWADQPSPHLQLPDELARQQGHSMTANIFLALAKHYQDIPSTQVTLPGFRGSLNVNHALAIMLYYLALSLSPSPSTYNNMGIILSGISETTSWVNESGERIVFSGTDLARVFYTSGLQMDPAHYHLLTNLGSLYKDQGSLDVAIELYTKALALKPDFDIALANMGNAVKDTGRSWEALEYYRRAVAINPDLPEAVCGLVSSMAAVCDWRGRDSSADEYGVDDVGNLIHPGAVSPALAQPSLMRRMITICTAQLAVAYSQNVHSVSATRASVDWLNAVQAAFGRPLTQREARHWQNLFDQFYDDLDCPASKINEGGFVIRLITWLQPRLQRRWYIKAYGKILSSNEQLNTDPSSYANQFLRPLLPRTMSSPVVPSILPFNTFIYPLDARTIRLISHRNALRIAYAALSQPWLPQHVYAPPGPPFSGVLNIAYVSNDVNNHPLSHLMQSVFGLHDKRRFKVFMYTTSPWDGTSYRPKISGDVEVFIDASSWSSEQIVQHIIQHRIHILINLGGYTKGARNDVFAARPCPIHLQLMGYAGTIGAGWCDYLVCDPMSCPPDMGGPERWRMKRNEAAKGPPSDTASAIETLLDLDADLDPEQDTNKWVFSEKFIYMPHTFMVTDHKQSFRADESLSPEARRQVPTATLWRNEEARREKMRQAWFPGVPQSTVIFANFNQLYKIDPGIYAIWMRILARVPNSILWLLRFPAAGEEYLLRTARQWAGEEVASRIHFTDVVKKDVHVHRGRVADLFLDTVECNAHTITADVIWPGTPILTFPKHRHKMCSRVAASMANATGFGEQMIVNSLQEYEDRAVELANGVKYTAVREPDSETIQRGEGELIALRRNLFLNRDKMPLFDTERWTRNIEKAYWEAWRRWVEGTQFEQSDEWEKCEGPEKQSGSIWVPDDDPVEIVRYD